MAELILYFVRHVDEKVKLECLSSKLSFGYFCIRAWSLKLMVPHPFFLFLKELPFSNEWM